MSLNEPYDPNNIFAKILRGEMPCRKVFEDDVALAFLDIFPQGPGHTLVIPRTEARNLLDMPADLLGPYMERVQRVAQAVQRAYAADGVTVFQFNGEAGGQSVFHLHFHIIPRTVGVGLSGHGQAAIADDDSLAEAVAKITAALS